MVTENSSAPPLTTQTRLFREVLASGFLARDVEISVIVPVVEEAMAPLPVLYLNDGQDLERLGLQATLEDLLARGAVQPFVVVAPHANELRVQEYGTAAHADYNGRGSLAGAYTRFVLEELVPFAQATYQASAAPAEAVVAGFSLGGLSAFDLAWHHPEAFLRAGVFSGSFWWRQRAVGAGYTPADRIMHRLVQARPPHPAHRFWLQTGTLDERGDRNENGVIDSIEDTLDLIEELSKAGLNPQQAIRYVQVEGGHHHQDTWGRVMPDFLIWAFGPPESRARLVAPLPVVRLHLAPELAPSVLPPTAPAGSGPVPPPLVLPAAAAAPVDVRIASPSTPLPMPVYRPAEGDYLPYAAGYINLVPESTAPLTMLREQAQQIRDVFTSLSEQQAEKAYAPGKWTLKEMLLHQIDTERVFAYRALRFARGDGQNLPGFEQDDYVAHSNANARSIASLLAEYDAVRAATLALFESFTEEQLDRRGTANGGATTVRALLYILPGHERHHLTIIEERYQPVL